jgi:hypothetical protein
MFNNIFLILFLPAGDIVRVISLLFGTLLLEVFKGKTKNLIEILAF